jgi:hypothetical protein
LTDERNSKVKIQKAKVKNIGRKKFYKMLNDKSNAADKCSPKGQAMLSDEWENEKF